MKEVRLYGHLAKRFGRSHRFDVSNPAEAVRAMCANFPEFEEVVVAHEPGYRVWSGREQLPDADALHMPIGERDVIKIAPVTAGAKRGGLFGIIIGAVLIAASFIPGVQGVTIPLIGSSLSSFFLSTGISMILGGVSQLLTPTPKLSAGEQRPENKPSYAFSGPLNVSAQGSAVPVGYGRLTIGSAVVSAGLYASDLAL